MTDEYKGYSHVKQVMRYEVVRHKERKYVEISDDDLAIYTNTIEGFWSLIKPAWYGQHHHYSKKYAPLYIAEACWKYNHQDAKEYLFEVFPEQCFR